MQRFYEKIKLSGSVFRATTTGFIYPGKVEELRHNPARGFQQLEQIEAVREVDWQVRPTPIWANRP